MSFLVCHMEKYKRNEVSPIEKENERDETFEAKNPQIDSSRTYQNYHVIGPRGKYLDFINQRISTLYLARKIRSDAIFMNSFVVGSDREFFSSMTKSEQRQFFIDCVRFFAIKYGEKNIISAIVHEDETTPHLHLNIVPITNGKLCSKDLFDKTKLSILQTELLEQVGKKYGLKRGKEGSQEKHLSTAEYKAKKIIAEAEKIKQSNQHYAEALKEAENGDLPWNRGKLREQVIATVAKNKDLTSRLNTSMSETLQLAKENQALKQKNERSSKALRVLATLQRENPREFDRIASGKPPDKTLNGFFNSVLSLFTSEVTSKSNRLREIEREIREEQKINELKISSSTNHWSK